MGSFVTKKPASISTPAQKPCTKCPVSPNCLAVGLTRVIARFLYGVTAADPFTFAAAGLVLLVVGVLACLIPARPATLFDPLAALGHE